MLHYCLYDVLNGMKFKIAQVSNIHMSTKYIFDLILGDYYLYLQNTFLSTIWNIN